MQAVTLQEDYRPLISGLGLCNNETSKTLGLRHQRISSILLVLSSPNRDM